MCSCRDKPGVSTLRPSVALAPGDVRRVSLPGTRDYQAKLPDQRNKNVPLSPASRSDEFWPIGPVQRDLEYSNHPSKHDVRCCPHPDDAHRLADSGRYCMSCRCRREW